MRAEAADERDARWETSDARLRVFVYDGAAGDVTTFDVVDASVDEVLRDVTPALDARGSMWSLALVVDDAVRGTGLVWLSGYDYHDTPRTGAEWRARRRMQDRYLSARVGRGERPLLPDGLRLIRVFGEWAGGLPLWESFTPAYHLHDGGDLPLSPSLRADLLAWSDTWQARAETDPEPPGWPREGAALVARLQAELAGIAEVRPEFLP